MSASVPASAPSLPQTGWRAHLPNVLTALRLFIALAFFVQLTVWNYSARELVATPTHPRWAYLFAAALFGLAAVTDAIDGPLARRWKVVSKFGRVMDPFADKVLVVGAFIMLAGPTFHYDVEGRQTFQVSGVYPWMVVVILGRELLVTSLRSMIEADGGDFSASASGKAKMIVQASVIPTILVALGITPITPGTWGRYLVDTCMWATVAITVVSGIPYVTRGFGLATKK